MSLKHLAAEYRKNWYTKPQYGLRRKVYDNPGCIITTPDGRIAGIASLRRKFAQDGMEIGKARLLLCRNGKYAVACCEKDDSNAGEYVHMEYVYFADTKEQALEQVDCVNNGDMKNEVLYKRGYLFYKVDRGQPVGIVELRWAEEKPAVAEDVEEAESVEAAEAAEQPEEAGEDEASKQTQADIAEEV